MKKSTFLKTFLLATILLVGNGLVWGENILPKLELLEKNTPSGDTGWVITNAAINNANTDYWKMLLGSSLVSPEMDFSAYTGVEVTLRLQSFGTVKDNSDKIKIEHWDGTVWTQVGDLIATTSSAKNNTVALPYVNTDAKLRITAPNATTVGARVFSVLITGTLYTTDPTITLTPTTLTGFTYEAGNGPSAEQTFTVSGTNLTADISLTAPISYELSKQTGTDFASTLTFTHTAGTVTETTVYVRLKSELAVANYNGEEVSATSGTASAKTVTCSGSVTTPPAPPAPDAPVATAATLVGDTEFTANWEVVTGATGYQLDVYKKGATLLSEDFSSITEGNSTGSTGSSATWDGNENFPLVNTAYKAGGSVKIGKSAGVGFITSKELDLSQGAVINFDVKGWTEVEGTILVTVDGVNEQTVTYTAVMADEFETKTLALAAATATSKVTLTTSAKRAFIGNVMISKKEAILTDVAVGNVTSYGVTGLSTASNYSYVVRATDDESTSVNSNTVSVTTTGTPTAIDQVTAPLSIYATGGRIYGAENARIYTILGMDVTEQNGNLNGIYVVKANGKTQKIAVK